MRHLVGSLLVALLFACSSGEDPASSGIPVTDGSRDPSARVGGGRVGEAPQETGPKVVFLGDSITAGLHLPADQAYPAVLQRRLREEGLPFRLVNAGISGDTSAGGVRRLDWLLKQEPDLLVVQLGANDGLRGQPVEEIEKNLRDIVTRAKARGARVLVLGMRIPPNYGVEYTESFAALYETVSNDLEVGFVPFFMESVAGYAEWNLEDELHPSAEGHERLADGLMVQLRELLGELSAE